MPKGIMVNKFVKKCSQLVYFDKRYFYKFLQGGLNLFGCVLQKLQLISENRKKEKVQKKEKRAACPEPNQPRPISLSRARSPAPAQQTARASLPFFSLPSLTGGTALSGTTTTSAATSSSPNHALVKHPNQSPSILAFKTVIDALDHPFLSPGLTSLFCSKNQSPRAPGLLVNIPKAPPLPLTSFSISGEPHRP